MTETIGVVVVAFNTKTHWPRLRAALEAQSLRDFTLLVIDNASRPEERLTESDMPARGALLQLEENIGFAAANNLGAARLDVDFLICLNPDAFPEPDWLANLAAAATRNPDAASIGSLQILAGDPRQLDGAGDCYWAGGLPYRSLYRRARPARLPPGETFSACAAAALYRRATFLELGGFEERFFCYCEDVDLGFRLRLAGWRSLQADDAIVAHVGGGAAGARSPFAVFHGTRNRLWTFVRNMPGPLFWTLAPLHVAMTLFVLVWSLFRGTAGPTWRGVGAALAGLPDCWRARRRIQRARRASNLAIARALMWSPLAVIVRNSVRRRAGAAAALDRSRRTFAPQ